MNVSVTVRLLSNLNDNEKKGEDIHVLQREYESIRTWVKFASTGAAWAQLSIFWKFCAHILHEGISEGKVGVLESCLACSVGSVLAETRADDMRSKATKRAKIRVMRWKRMNMIDWWNAVRIAKLQVLASGVPSPFFFSLLLFSMGICVVVVLQMRLGRWIQRASPKVLASTSRLRPGKYWSPYHGGYSLRRCLFTQTKPNNTLNL